MLVGVGLTQIGHLYTEIGNFSNSLTNLFSGKLSDGPVAVATVIAFLSSGFLWGYFESRTSLLLVFNDAPILDDDPIALAAVTGAAVGAATGESAGAAAGAVTGAMTGAQAGAAAAAQKTAPDTAEAHAVPKETDHS